jgi:hypothetical protein
VQLLLNRRSKLLRGVPKLELVTHFLLSLRSLGAALKLIDREGGVECLASVDAEHCRQRSHHQPVVIGRESLDLRLPIDPSLVGASAQLGAAAGKWLLLLHQKILPSLAGAVSRAISLCAPSASTTRRSNVVPAANACAPSSLRPACGNVLSKSSAENGKAGAIFLQSAVNQSSGFP